MSSSVSATLVLELHACRWQTAVSLAAICACALVDRIRRGEDWCLHERAVRTIHTRLHRNTRFFRHFIGLRFASQHSVLVGPGDLRDQFRRLQVMLRQRSGMLVREHVA